MAIETFPENDLTLGRGRLYFAQFNTGTTTPGAERYLGSTPTISMERASEVLEHISTESGIRVKDRSITLQDDITTNFEVENMTADNTALFFYGDVVTAAQSTVAGAETINAVDLGGHYQLGITALYPSGKRDISTLVLTVLGDTAPTAAAGNYETDLTLGRFHIFPNASDILANDTITAAYAVAATARTIVIDGSNAIEGAMRFISDNAEGSNTDIYFPRVKLTPDGQYALKGEEWVKIGFKAEVLKLGTLARIYLDKR